MNIFKVKTKTEVFTEIYEFVSTIGEGKKIRFSKSKNKYEICAENFDKSNVGYCLNAFIPKKTVLWIGESASRAWNGESGEKTVAHISNIKLSAEAAEKEVGEKIRQIKLDFDKKKCKNPIEAIKEIDDQTLRISACIKKITEIQKSAKIGEKNLIETYRGRKEGDQLADEFQKIEAIVDAISSKKLDLEKLRDRSIDELVRQGVARIWNRSLAYFENPRSNEREKIIVEIQNLIKAAHEFIKTEKLNSYVTKLDKNIEKIKESTTLENSTSVKEEIEKFFLENTFSPDLDVRSENIFNQSKSSQKVESTSQEKKKNLQILRNFITKNKKSIHLKIANKEAILSFREHPKSLSIIDLTASDLEKCLAHADKVREFILENRYMLFSIKSKSITQKKNLLFFEFTFPEMDFSLDVAEQFPAVDLEKKSLHHRNIELISKKIKNINSDFQIDYKQSNFKENSLLLRSKTIQDLCFSVPLEKNDLEIEPYLEKIETLKLTEENRISIIESKEKQKKFEFKNSTIEISNKLLFEGIINGKFRLNEQQFFITKNCNIFVVENKRLGQGGLNRVYQVYDLQNKKHFALIKTRPANKSSDPADLDKQYLLCFEEMEQGCATLKKLNADGATEGIPSCSSEVTLFFGKKMHRKGFMLMELADCDLHKIALDGTLSKLDLKTQLKLFKSLIVGLCAAHEKDIGHGDIKPTNILVKKNEQGEPVLFFIGDWSGAAERAKNANYFIHTPSFMPSDVISNEPSLKGLKRADIFALSLTILQSLNGGKALKLKRRFVQPQWYPIFFDMHTEEEQEKITGELQHIDQPILNVLLKGLSSDAPFEPDIKTFLSDYEKAIEQIE